MAFHCETAANNQTKPRRGIRLANHKRANLVSPRISKSASYRCFPAMPSPSQRVTLKQIAQAAGVARSTVSKALKDSSEISVAQRRRIQSIAAEMNYRPDPALAALAAYRTGTRSTVKYEKLAFVTARPERFETIEGSLPWHQFQAAKSEAATLGYELELFYLGRSKREAARLSRVLQSRGIHPHGQERVAGGQRAADQKEQRLPSFLSVESRRARHRRPPLSATTGSAPC